MPATALVRRVVLVVLDGLRPDAIPSFSLETIASLADAGAFTAAGTTVAPSVTAACMASVLCGVRPSRHGVTSTRFHIPRRNQPVFPLPALLRDAGLPTSFFMAELPFLCRGLAKRVATHLGIGGTGFKGKNSSGVLDAARGALRSQREGLIVMHWPDADDAGHKSGWMSDAYAGAARCMDRTLADAANIIDAPWAADTMLIAIADHGGGGHVLTDHDSDHPLDRTIPILMAGGGIAPQIMPPEVSLLDVPATILWALGAARHGSYDGRPLTELVDSAALTAR